MHLFTYFSPSPTISSLSLEREYVHSFRERKYFSWRWKYVVFLCVRVGGSLFILVWRRMNALHKEKNSMAEMPWASNWKLASFQLFFYFRRKVFSLRKKWLSPSVRICVHVTVYRYMILRSLTGKSFYPPRTEQYPFLPTTLEFLFMILRIKQIIY